VRSPPIFPEASPCFPMTPMPHPCLSHPPLHVLSLQFYDVHFGQCILQIVEKAVGSTNCRVFFLDNIILGRGPHLQVPSTLGFSDICSPRIVYAVIIFRDTVSRNHQSTLHLYMYVLYMSVPATMYIHGPAGYHAQVRSVVARRPCNIKHRSIKLSSALPPLLCPVH
jgi:hypothetical protein